MPLDEQLRAVIKAQTEKTITVAGWLVKFGGADLYGERFDEETNFWLDTVGSTPVVLYDHGFNDAVQKSVLGMGVITKQKDGLWVEAELAKHDKYVQQIAVLIGHGVMGWSSGSVGHLVDRDFSENPVRIKSWPIVEASLTVTPAEPRTLGVEQLRTLAGLNPGLKELVPQDAAKASAPAGSPAVTVVANPQSAKQQETEMTGELDALNTKVDGLTTALATLGPAIESILKRFEEEPPLRNAGYVSPDGGLKDPKVKSFADYLVAVRRNDTKRLAEHYGVKAALAEDSGQTGGYLVPTQFRADLLKVAAEAGIVRPRAYKQPMAGRELEIPALAQTAAPTAGTTNFFGGVQTYWTGEAGTITETEPTFDMVRLVAHKIAGLTIASNELMADSAIGLEALLKRLFGESIAWNEDYNFLRGNGVAKPLGIQNAPALINVSRAGSGNDFDPADVGAMLKRMLPSSMKNAVWIMHPFVIPSLILMTASSSAAVTWIGDMRNGMPATLLGLPIVFSEKMVVSGTAFDVLLADLSYYVIGDRDELAIAFSEHYKFGTDQNTWRFTHRVDGQPWIKGPIYLPDATNTISPFVALS